MNDSSRADKKQIGLTPKGQEDLVKVMATGWFLEEQDAYRVAIAVALAADVASDAMDLAQVTNKYNFAGGVDADNRVRALIAAFAPADSAAPGRYAERLAHAGLAILAAKVGEDEVLLADVLQGK